MKRETIGGALASPDAGDGLPSAFCVGVNLPWLQYGCDFGANVWQPNGGVSRPEQRGRLRRSFAGLAARGLRTVRWFMFADGRAGIEFESRSIVRGLDAAFRQDLDVALDEAARAGVALVPVLFDFGWCQRRRVIAGVACGGHRRCLTDGAPRRALIERLVVPLLRRCAGGPIAAWDIFNEPEWVTWGVGTLVPWSSVTRAIMRGFIRDVAAVVRAETRHPATVGLASSRGAKLVRGLGLDVYQVHWYDRRERAAPLGVIPDALADRPVWLGEFPTAGSARRPGEILGIARQSGYSAAFAWSAEAVDPHSDLDQLDRG